MIDLVRRLLPASVPVHDTVATTADLSRLPYVLVIGGAGARSDEESACGRDSATGDVIVRVVGASRRSIMDVLTRLRAGLDRARFTDGYGVHSLILDSHRPPQADTDATIPGTGNYPLFADDEYTIFTERLVNAGGVNQG